MATLEEEKGLIGALLEDGVDVIGLVRDRYRLRSEHLTHAPVRRLYETAIELDDAGKGITVQGLQAVCENEGWWERCGGLTFLSGCQNNALLVHSLDDFCQRLQIHHRQRRYVMRLRAELEAAEADPQKIPALRHRLMQDICEMDVGGTGTHVPPVDRHAEEFRGILDRRFESGYCGLQTPWGCINKTLGGIEQGQMVVVSAPMKVGKTALASCLMHQWSVCEHRPCLFFSLEMSGPEMYGVLAKIETGHDYGRQYDPWTGEQREVYEAAEKRICEAPVLIDAETRDIQDIVATCRELVPERGIEAVFVDFIQLAATKEQGNWYEKVAHASQQLKLAVGKALRVPVIVLSQITRNSDGGIKGMRHGQELEQACDKLILLSRLDQYRGLEADDEPTPSPRKVRVAYNRQGPTATHEMLFDKTTYEWREDGRSDDGDIRDIPL